MYIFRHVQWRETVAGDMRRNLLSERTFQRDSDAVVRDTA